MKFIALEIVASICVIAVAVMAGGPLVWPIDCLASFAVASVLSWALQKSLRRLRRSLP